MLTTGQFYHKRESLAKVIEKHGNNIGRQAKQIKSLRGGNGVHFRCVSFDEELMECVCSFSVYFSRSRKKCDNIKCFDENGSEVDNSVWFIPLKSKLCTTHTCEIECINNKEGSYTNSIVKQIRTTALSAKVDFERFKDKIAENSNSGTFLNEPHMFASFEIPKLSLSFELPSCADVPEKYGHFKHPNKSNRTPKLVRITSQPSLPRPMIDDHIKSELAILLEELDAQYMLLSLQAAEAKDRRNTPPPPDPLIIEYENEIDAVKLAIQAKLRDRLFLFDEHTIKLEKNGRKSNCWNLECDIESWKRNSTWWDICVSKFPLGDEWSEEIWDQDSNHYNEFRSGKIRLV